MGKASSHLEKFTVIQPHINIMLTYICSYSFFIHIVIYLSLSHVWIFCNPMDCSLTGYSVHGVSQARILEWVAISSSRGSFWPGNRTRIICDSCVGKQVCVERGCILNPLHLKYLSFENLTNIYNYVRTLLGPLWHPWKVLMQVEEATTLISGVHY